MLEIYRRGDDLDAGNKHCLHVELTVLQYVLYIAGNFKRLLFVKTDLQVLGPKMTPTALYTVL